jgi:lipase
MQPAVCRQSIGDMEIQYLDYAGDGPALLMLHATGFLPWLWHPIARELSRTYRVIAPFLCNHRDIDAAKGWLGWLDLAFDIKRLCDRMQLGTPLMVGHSMGAAVSTLAHTMHGLAVAKMVLIEPIFLPPETYDRRISIEQHPLAAKAIRRRNSWRNRDEVWDDFKGKPFFQSWDDEILSLYIAYGITGDNGNGVHLTCPPDREAALFMGSVQCNPWPELVKVKGPALVMEGGQSENKPWIDLKRVSGLIPNGAYLEVENAGHLIPMEKPAETLNIIQSFFQ